MQEKTKTYGNDSPANTIAHGRNVLAQEIKGLSALADALGNEFAQAVELIANLRGRLVITGMGKSGHVARKIAATMASTGTPAFFVHPGEASHGDLGMVMPGDAVMALSNSGETAELSDMIVYCKRHHIPLIAVVRRHGSMLTSDADIAMVLPDTPEASPTGAPTTSTTMMMALGDAIAVALCERKGFTREDFSVFHPGGKLGKAFIRVRDLMHKATSLPLIAESSSMDEAILTMTKGSFGCTGVLSNKKLVGIITDGDLRRHMDDGLLVKLAKDVMHENPLTIRADALAVEALTLMNDRKVTSLFIVDDAGQPEGIIHIHDCLRAGIG
ncbi:MAG: SIS domain-containing protein [Alphaproteobacteria bacterium]